MSAAYTIVHHSRVGIEGVESMGVHAEACQDQSRRIRMLAAILHQSYL